jgi:hypothetical protein
MMRSPESMVVSILVKLQPTIESVTMPTNVMPNVADPETIDASVATKWKLYSLLVATKNSSVVSKKDEDTFMYSEAVSGTPVSSTTNRFPVTENKTFPPLTPHPTHSLMFAVVMKLLLPCTELIKITGESPCSIIDCSNAITLDDIMLMFTTLCSDEVTVMNDFPTTAIVDVSHVPVTATNEHDPLVNVTPLAVNADPTSDENEIQSSVASLKESVADVSGSVNDMPPNVDPPPPTMRRLDSATVEPTAPTSPPPPTVSVIGSVPSSETEPTAPPRIVTFEPPAMVSAVTAAVADISSVVGPVMDSDVTKPATLIAPEPVIVDTVAPANTYAAPVDVRCVIVAPPLTFTVPSIWFMYVTEEPLKK